MVGSAPALFLIVVMDRCHQENSGASRFEIQHLNDDAQRLDHKQPANDGPNNFVFGGHRNGPQCATQRQSPGIAP